MKILITGGHVTPALSVIDELKKNNHEVIFVGRRYVNKQEKKDSFEYSEVIKREIKFIEFDSGRFTRTWSFSLIFNLVSLFQSLFKAFFIISQEKPDSVISFGGYLAVPITLASYLQGVSVYTHEQTMVPGLANRLIAFFAKKIFIAFPQAQQHFNPKKTILVGNPIRNQITQPNRLDLPFKTSRPVIYVTGGSLGAHGLNMHIRQILPALIKRYFVAHQIGNLTEFDDWSKLSELRSENYLPQQHFDSKETSAILHSADIVVSRSGANTVFELIACSVPAILIPLPISAGKEQQAHASLLKQAGAAEVFDQAQDSQQLLELIQKVYLTKDKYRSGYDSLKKYLLPDAAEKMVMAVTSQI